MTETKRIFIDTSGWVELILKGEKYHKDVANYFIDEDKKGSKFFTNDYVLDEAWTKLITSHSFTAAKALREKTRQAQEVFKLHIIWTDEILFNQAWEAFEKFSEHKLSFTDALIARVVQSLKIDEILSLDKGFQKVGFTVKPDIGQ